MESGLGWDDTGVRWGEWVGLDWMGMGVGAARTDLEHNWRSVFHDIQEAACDCRNLFVGANDKFFAGSDPAKLASAVAAELRKGDSLVQ